MIGSETRVFMDLTGSTGNRQDYYRSSDSGQWASGQPTVQFNEGAHVDVQDEGGDASVDATLSCRTNVNAERGVALSSQFETDVLGSAGGNASGRARLGTQVSAMFDVAVDTMRYELRFDPGGETDAGVLQHWGVSFRLGKGGDPDSVFVEQQTGAELHERVLAGTLAPGRYQLTLSIVSDSRWSQQGAARATGGASIWVSVE